MDFMEYHMEHSDAIVSLEVYPDGPLAAASCKKKDKQGEKVNPNSESLVLSADRDGNLVLWRVSADSDEVLSFVHTVQVPEPATRAKFSSDSRILVSTTHGTIWSILILKDS